MTKIFARIYNDQVAEIVQEIEDITKEWADEFVAALVDITDEDPQPDQHWLYQDGVFSPPPLPVYPPKQQRQIALTGGCGVTYTPDDTLSATYYASGTIWENMKSEALYIVTYSSFSGGFSSLHVPVLDKPEVVFTATPDYMAVVKAIGDWITQWSAYVNGQSPDPPANTTVVNS